MLNCLLPSLLRRRVVVEARTRRRVARAEAGLDARRITSCFRLVRDSIVVTVRMNAVVLDV